MSKQLIFKVGIGSGFEREYGVPGGNGVPHPSIFFQRQTELALP